MEGASAANLQGMQISDVRNRTCYPASSSRSSPAPVSNVSSALSIGISSYNSAEAEKWTEADSGEEVSGCLWQDLGACEKEAALFADTVRKHLTRNVQQIPMRDEGHAPKRDILRKQLRRAVDRWIGKMKDNSTHLFFYAGHGYQSDGDFSLVPSDSEGTDDDIKLSRIRNKIDEQTQHCRVILFIAACRDPPFEEPERESAPRFAYECEMWNDRYDKAKLRRNYYLEFFACRPQETVEDVGFGKCGPFVQSLVKHLANRALSINQIIDHVRDDVVEATANKEQPCVGLQSLSNFHLHEQTPAASEYSHGLVGRRTPTAIEPLKGLPMDGHRQWRVRVNRLTVRSNIPKPCLVLLTDTCGKTSSDSLLHFEHTGMGPHYIISKDGRRIQLVEENLAAWCGNPGFWGELADRAKLPAGGFVNEVQYFAISVALEGDGTCEAFAAQQYSALVALLKEVSERYDILPWNIIGLSEICMPPGKSRAPGQHFEWGRLVSAGLTFGAELRSVLAPPTGTTDQEIRHLMEDWGYCLGSSDDEFAHRIQSFHDRYQRPASVDDHSFVLPALRVLLEQRRKARQAKK